MTKKMKSFDFLAVALLAVVIVIPGATSHAQQAVPAAQSEPVAQSGDDLAATDLAKKIYLQLASGTVDRSLLTPEMSKALTAESITSLVPQLKAFGSPIDFTFTEKSKIAAGTNYKFTVEFSDEQHHIQMYLDAQGLVGGYFIRP